MLPLSVTFKARKGNKEITTKILLTGSRVLGVTLGGSSTLDTLDIPAGVGKRIVFARELLDQAYVLLFIVGLELLGCGTGFTVCQQKNRHGHYERERVCVCSGRAVT